MSTRGMSVDMSTGTRTADRLLAMATRTQFRQEKKNIQAALAGLRESGIRFHSALNQVLRWHQVKIAKGVLLPLAKGVDLELDDLIRTFERETGDYNRDITRGFPTESRVSNLLRDALATTLSPSGKKRISKFLASSKPTVLVLAEETGVWRKVKIVIRRVKDQPGVQAVMYPAEWVYVPPMPGKMAMMGVWGAYGPRRTQP